MASYVGTVYCKAAGCQHKEHAVCYEGERLPTGRGRYTCPDTSKVVEPVDAGSVAWLPDEPCPSEAVTFELLDE